MPSLSGCSSTPSRNRISSAVPTPPGKITMAWAIRAKASRRFSMSGMITSSLTIGLGDSAAMMPGLRQADVAAVADALLRVADGGALHGALHGAGTAAGAHVELAQPELVANLLGVVVLLATDRVPAPADDDVGLDASLQDARIAQDVEHRVGDAVAGIKVELAAGRELAVDVDHIPEDGEQQLANAANHLAVHEGAGRRIPQGQLHAAVLLDDADVEVAVLVQHLAGVVGGAAGIQDGQGTAPQQLVLTTLTAYCRRRLTSCWESTSRAPSGITSMKVWQGHRAARQGRIWIGVLSGVISQISTMSAFETAMQPLVQSRVW